MFPAELSPDVVVDTSPVPQYDPQFGVLPVAQSRSVLVLTHQWLEDAISGLITTPKPKPVSVVGVSLRIMNL